VETFTIEQGIKNHERKVQRYLRMARKFDANLESANHHSVCGVYEDVLTQILMRHPEMIDIVPTIFVALDERINR
jgi:hypothetical protein